MPYIKHRILVYLFLFEYIDRKEEFSTSEISEALDIERKVLTTTLNRMKGRKYITSDHKKIDYYIYYDKGSKKHEIMEISDDNLKGSVKGNKQYLLQGRKRISLWKLTKEGKRYAKFIYFKSWRYNIEDEASSYEMKLLHSRHPEGLKLVLEREDQEPKELYNDRNLKSHNK